MSLLITLFGCSTLYNYDSGWPFDDDTAVEETDVCANTGVGFPDNGDWGSGELNVEWMVESHAIRVTAECMTIPPFHIASTEDGEWPITSIAFGIGSYDHAQWVNTFGNELTIDGTSGDLGTYASVGTTCGPFEGLCWEVDLSDHDVTVSQEQDAYLQFQLPGFSDPSTIDELWDDEDDQLAIMVTAGHSWSEEMSDGHYEFGGYAAGSLLTVIVEPVE